MWFWDFMLTVPSWIRLLLCIALFVGFGVVAIRASSTRALALLQHAESEGYPTGTAKPIDMLARVVSFTLVAFVFLTGIAISQFWLNGREALNATSAEASQYSFAVTYASRLPTAAGRDNVLAALEQYRVTVTQDEWPLLQHAQATEAYDLQAQAGRDVGAALMSAADAGAVDDPAWGNLETAVNDMLLAGTDRINAIPLPAAMSWVYLVFTLGMVANIALALSTPARLRFGLPVMCLAAFITALLVFLAFELCNPYLVGEYSIPLAHMTTSALGAAP